MGAADVDYEDFHAYIIALYIQCGEEMPCTCWEAGAPALILIRDLSKCRILPQKSMAALRFVVSALLAAIPIQAERLPIRAYTTADGLPTNSVNCIVPDSRGFLWLCTGDGRALREGLVSSTPAEVSFRIFAPVWRGAGGRFHRPCCLLHRSYTRSAPLSCCSTGSNGEGAHAYRNGSA